MHEELNLNVSTVGLLNGLPPLFLACASVPGSMLIARLGVRNALVIGLILIAAAGAARGLFSSVLWLETATAFMGVGVAVAQVSIPSAVREWVPKEIALGTAVYTNGLLIGEILPVALMYPLVLPLVRTNWHWAFPIWSVPVLLTSVLLWVAKSESNARPIKSMQPLYWWPNWRDPLTWQLGVMFGTVNAVYFASNGFLPDFLTVRQQQEWIAPSLAALNLGQLPASLLLLAFASRIARRDMVLVACGLVLMIGIAVVVFTSGIWIVAGAAIMGFAAAATFVLLLALPPLLSPSDEVHRVTAAMFTISYSVAVIVPLICGAAWDVSGEVGYVFVPVTMCGLALIFIAASTPAIR
jgi:CP family cyanate transporter-like MFS transporter